MNKNFLIGLMIIAIMALLLTNVHLVQSRLTYGLEEFERGSITSAQYTYHFGRLPSKAFRIVSFCRNEPKTIAELEILKKEARKLSSLGNFDIERLR